MTESVSAVLFGFDAIALCSEDGESLVFHLTRGAQNKLSGRAGGEAEV